VNRTYDSSTGIRITILSYSAAEPEIFGSSGCTLSFMYLFSR
jgi:hypothetical protein